MITWRLVLLAGSQLENGGYKNIYSGHFIDENGNEYNEDGVFVQNLGDEDGYKN